MWLLPLLPRVASLATRTYYRLSRAGERVPREGPVLVVANHPNSLLDPALVSVAAERPIRFLAKAPLFTDPLVGWLVRGAGSIPVYRRQDDAAQVGRNEEMFAAVYAALVGGSAVGIFPEGLSHSNPSLAPLRTGAARIALGAAAARGGVPFPIVPVGLVFRDKDVFRSEALLVVGRPVAWDDLAPGDPGDAGAVRVLTERIDAALREVTVNLERWEDAPVVEAAEAIWSAEYGAEPGDVHRLGRTHEAARLLERVRAEGDARWAPLARDVRIHARALARLRLRPADLAAPEPTTVGAAWWTVRQLPFAAAALLAVLGAAIYWLPYRATGWVADRAGPAEDIRSTWKLLAGALLHVAWTVLLAALAAWSGGWVAGAAALVLLPVLALLALHTLERWGRAREDARRFFALRRGARLADLRARQRALAERLRALREGVVAERR
ncbi:MAG TPA: 1-acyl-sn-glycerol-3-phosphate acyltransferase [Gemmatimonadaceae bacterium]